MNLKSFCYLILLARLQNNYFLNKIKYYFNKKDIFFCNLANSKVKT